MSRNIDDISSIFRVSGHPDTIFAKENCFLEKSEKIAQYRRYIADISINYLYIQYKSDTKMQACEKILKNTQNGRYSGDKCRYIGHFVCFLRNFSKKKN